MNTLLEKLSKNYKHLLKKKKMPTFEQPMLATLTKNYFSDKDWIYECKFDGVRCLLFKNEDSIRIKSRANKTLNSTYPELVDSAQSFTADHIIIDGEITTLVNKISNFSKLQARLGVKNPSHALIKSVKLYFYVFDILYLDGYDITQLPLRKRKKILKQVIKFKPPFYYVAHKQKDGIAYFKQACKKGWEGIIAKDASSAYVHERSANWLKFKCVQEQELVICGYTEPRQSRIGFGALLVGYYIGKKLYYAGKVGTGYNNAFLHVFSKKLKKIEIKHNPFEHPESVQEQHVHFVKPYHVGQFGFEEWTKDNKLRQGRFLGLRDDKKASDVAQELA